MSKLNRILWSGLVLVGAACGDDVTVTPPPEPPAPGIRSVTVAPDGANVAVAGTLQMTAAVTLDAGATGAPTIAWSSSDNAKATVSATGLVTGVAVGSVGIRATATLGTSTGQGVATVNVVGTTGCVISGVSISPASAQLVVGETLTLAPSVSGQNCVAADLGATFSSGNTAIATVSATGVVTAVGAGTTTIVVKSTKDDTKQAAMSVQVTVPSPVTISIQSITQGGLGTPINLNNVAGQIEITLTIDAGGRAVEKVEALIGGVRVAGQAFANASAPAASDAAASAPVTVVLNVNTQQLTKDNDSDLFIPVVYNGQKAITANMLVTGSSTPVSSNAVPVLMNNSDEALVPEALFDAPGINHGVPEPFVDGAGREWFTGPFFTQFNYLAFGDRLPISSETELDETCGPQTSSLGPIASQGPGTGRQGILVANQWLCLDEEGPQDIVGPGDTDWALNVVGPDGSTLQEPEVYSRVGSLFCLSTIDPCPAEFERWNLIKPTGEGNTMPPGAPVPTFYVDNKAPAVLGTVAFNPNFDQQWISTTFDFAAAISGTPEALGSGSGYNPDRDKAFLYDGTLTAPPGPVPTCDTGSTVELENTHGLAQTLTDQLGDSYRACLEVADNIGNVNRRLSNNFGVDTEAPSSRLYLATGVDPFGGYLVSSVSATPNTSKYGALAAIINQPWVIEGVDSRSGFNQIDADPTLAVHYYANVQSLTQVSPTSVPDAGNAACALADDLLTTLSDAWKRSAFPIAGQDQLDCGAGVGYYFYSGYVQDRAGNQSPGIVRNFVYDLAAPNMSGLGFQTTPYQVGQLGQFSFSANDDLNIVEAQLGFNYTGLRAPAVGINFPYGSGAVVTGPGFGPIWATLRSQLAFIMNGATVSAPVLFRIDETCAFNADPYPSCDVTTYGPGSRPVLVADYNTNLSGGGALTDQQKLPNAVLANVRDVIGRESLTGASGSVLNTQFFPTTGTPAPWGVATDIPPVGLDIANWTAATVGSNKVATHKTRSSNGLPVFSGGAHLFRLNTVTNVWTHCAVMTGGSSPSIDNGTFRTWTYTTVEPGSTSPCNAANGVTGPWQVFGISNGAALGTPLF